MVSRGPPSAFAYWSACRNEPGPPSFVFVTSNVVAPGVTVVTANTVLFAGFGSDVVAAMPAIVVTVPPARVWASTPIEADAPLASVPSWHVTRPRSSVQVPTAGVADRNVMVAPNATVTCTFVTGSGLLFDTFTA